MNLDLNLVAPIYLGWILLCSLLAYWLAKSNGLKTSQWVVVTFIASFFGILGLIPPIVMLAKGKRKEPAPSL